MNYFASSLIQAFPKRSRSILHVSNVDKISEKRFYELLSWIVAYEKVHVSKNMRSDLTVIFNIANNHFLSALKTLVVCIVSRIVILL